MTKDRREQEIQDMADRVRTMVENFASDVCADNPGEEYGYAIGLAMAGVRRVAREGLEA
jgi:hypothetical protein